MAVTENLHTGNGSKTNYSFTFPYLKTTDIKASVDGTVVTNFTAGSPTATEIQFNTAPANNAAIRIYRDTATDNLSATFYAGSAIKSEDLNDNFLQNLYVTQEAKRDADAAWQDGDETINSTETWVSDNNKVATTGAIDGRVDAKIDTALTTDVSGGDGVTIVDNNPGSGQIRVDLDADIATLKDMQSGAATQLAALTSTELGILDGATVSTAELNLLDGVTSTTAELNILDGVTATKDEINLLDGVTATTAELNILDGVTATKDEINLLDGVTATTTELNLLDGVTATTTELNYVDGVTSNIQTQLNAKQGLHENLTTWAAASTNTVNSLVALTNTEAAILDGATVTTNELNILDGVTATTAELNKLDGVTATTAELNKTDGLTATPTELNTLDGVTTNTSELNKLDGVTASTAELNIVAGKSFKTSSGTLDTTSDTEIPSSKVIAAHVASSQTAIGGFITIADEVSFPTTANMPANGVVVSINNAAGVVVNGSGVSTTGRTTDGTPATVTINNFPSSLNGETLAAGVGLMVTATSTGNTYNYHKILAAETDVKQLSDDINDFNARYRVAGSAPSSNNDAGDLYFDTAANKMKVYNGTTSAWDDVASVGNFYINTISSSSGTGGGSATFNGSAYRFTLSNPPTMAQQLIVSVNGVIQKPNAGTSQPSEGFAISGNDIIFSAAPASGSDYFIVTQGSSVSIGTPSDNTVTSAKIVDGSIVNGDISSSANIAGSKVADDSIPEVKLDIHNAPSGTDKFLKYTSNGMEWAVPPVTDISGKADLSGATFTGDVTFDGATSGRDIVFDRSEDILKFKDYVKASFGDDSDLSIYHDGSDSYIKDDGTGKLRVLCSDFFVTNAADNEAKLKAHDNGAVELFHDNSKKLETTSSGINVTGSINVNGTALSAAPEITATASGAIAANKAVIVNSNGTVSVPTATAPALGSQGTAGSAIVGQGHHQVHYDATTGKIVLVWIKSWFPYAKVGTVSGTSITWGDEVQLSTGGWDVRRLGDLVYDSTNDKYVVTFTQANDSGGIRSTWFTVSGTTVTWGGSSSQQTIQATNGQHIRAVYTGSGKIAVAYGDAFNNIVMKTGTIGSGSNNITWAGSTTTVEGSGGNMYMGLVYDPDNSNVIIIYSGDSTTMYYRVQGLTNSGSGINNGTERTYSTHTATSQVQICHHPRGSGSGAGRIIVFAHQSTSQTNPVTNNGLHYRVGSVSGDTITFGSNVEVTNGWSTHPPRIATAYNAERKKTVFIYGDTGTGNYYPRLREITVTDGSTNSSMSSATTVIANVVTDLNMVYDSTTKQDVIFYETSGHASAYKIRSAESSTANSGNFIGFSDAAYSDGNTATIAVTGNTSTQSSLTAGQKYYLQNDGSISTTSSSMEAGIALSSTKLLIKG